MTLVERLYLFASRATDPEVQTALYDAAEAIETMEVELSKYKDAYDV